MGLRYKWYNSEPIQYQLIEGLKYHEGVFLKNVGGGGVRNLKINSVGFLIPNMKEWKFINGLYNLYQSLGTFPEMERASWNRIEYKKQKEDFRKNHMNQMKGYDFVFDIDRLQDESDLTNCYNSAKKVKKFLDENKIIYYLIFSGQKGFHFRIDYNDFGKYLKSLSMPKIISILKLFSERVKYIERIPNIDLSIIDSRRFIKTPYSVVIPDPKYFPIHEFRIAMPLSDLQFEDFKIENYLLSKQIYNINNLRNRGILKREGNPEGFSELVKKYTEDN